MSFEDPELPSTEGSEIEAVLDVSAKDEAGKLRPIFISQDHEQFLQLTIEDAKRLHGFLSDALSFLEDFPKRSIQ